MLREIAKEDFVLVSGGDLDVSLDDGYFAGEDFSTVTGMSVTDNGDGSYQMSLTFSGGDYYYDDGTAKGAVAPMEGKSGSRTVTQTIVRDSGQTTVSGTFSGNLTVFGKGVSVKGTVTVTGPRTVTTTSTTTTRGGGGTSGGTGGSGGSTTKKVVQK